MNYLEQSFTFWGSYFLFYAFLKKVIKTWNMHPENFFFGFPKYNLNLHRFVHNSYLVYLFWVIKPIFKNAVFLAHVLHRSELHRFPNLNYISHFLVSIKFFALFLYNSLSTFMKNEKCDDPHLQHHILIIKKWMTGYQCSISIFWFNCRETLCLYCL